MNCLSKALKIFDILFLLCFSVYAISPLTYTAQGAKNEKGGPGTIQTHGVSLYLVKLILANAVFQEDEDEMGEQETTSASHLLLKKKRAVLSSKNLKALMLLQVLEAMSLDATFLSDTPVLARTVPYDQPNFYQHAVLPLHSGNSPPTV